MKTLFILLGSIFSFISFAQVSPCNCRITVYGDIHATVIDNSREDEIKNTQKWLYSAVKEKIVVVEGLTIFGPLTKDSLVFGLMSELKKRKNISISYSDAFLSLKEQSSSDTKIRFILEGKKIVFGGEDAAIHRRILALDPVIATYPEILDIRSEMIYNYALRACKKYPNSNIAIIIGRKHLSWFKKIGVKTIDVPGYK